MATSRGKARAKEMRAVGLPADVPHELSYRRSTQLPAMSVRVRRSVSPAVLRRVQAYLRRIKSFAAVQDVERAAERIEALHGDETLRWLKQLAYRERHRPQGTLTGENAVNRKLDWNSVGEIRALYEAGGWSQHALAKRFGVSQPTIAQIIQGVTWRDRRYRPEPSVWEQGGFDPYGDTYGEDGLERLWADLLSRGRTMDGPEFVKVIDALATDWLRIRRKADMDVVVNPHDRFAVFWASYPRRVAKGEARKAFDKLQVSDALLSRMLAALEWQREQPSWQKDDGQFIPHAATWLRGERWEDEPVVVTARPGTTVAERNLHGLREDLAVLDEFRRGSEAGGADQISHRHAGADTDERGGPRRVVPHLPRRAG